MKIEHNAYVPILKWRMGEYQALYRLSKGAKSAITPLIVIPPIEWDFEEECLKKTVDEHILPFPGKYDDKWGNKNALIDIHESLQLESMANGRPVLEFIFDELRARETGAIPVTGLLRDQSYAEQVKRIVSLDNRGVCLRVGFTDLMMPDLNERLKGIHGDIEVDPPDIDLLLDFGEPENFEPLDVLAKLIAGRMKSINALNDYRSLVVAGMSLKLSEVKRPGNEVPRSEWALYKELISILGNTRVPSYGDYTVETPKFLDMDMRLLNPAGKIVYTCDDTWLISKGGSFRDNNAQMKEHCETIIKSGHFSGENFSFGDKRISDTASGADGFGNQTTWKQVAVNHHIEKVVDQLSKLSFP